MKFQMNHILPVLMGATFVERSAANWFITKTTPSTIAFGDDGGSEIVATFNVSKDQAGEEFLEVNFLEADTCNTTLYNSLSANVTGVEETDNDDSGMSVSAFPSTRTILPNLAHGTGRTLPLPNLPSALGSIW